MSKITDSGNNYYVAGQGDYIKAGKAGQESGDDTDFMEALKKRKEEILDKVRKGETEESFQLGNQSFTIKQWNKLVKRIDEAIEDMQETAERKEEKQEQQIKEKKADSITMEMLAELLGIGVEETLEEKKGLTVK